MTTKERIQSAIVVAMKSKDSSRLTVLRMAKNNIDLKEKESKTVLDNHTAEAILGTMIKQRKDSIDQFTKGNRLDLVEQEAVEIKIIEEFLPKEATREVVVNWVGMIYKGWLNQPPTMKDLGAIIKSAKEAITAYNMRVDGKLLSDIVREHIGK